LGIRNFWLRLDSYWCSRWSSFINYVPKDMDGMNCKNGQNCGRRSVWSWCHTKMAEFTTKPHS
jgi:hypothetical protein